MKLTEAIDTMQSLLIGRRRRRSRCTTPTVRRWSRRSGFRLHGDAFQIVMAIGDRKLAHLRRDPRCILLIFETIPPFRGVQVHGRATMASDDGAEVRLAIASRYLGPDRGRGYPDTERRPPGIVVSLPVADARAWDLARSLPLGVASPTVIGYPPPGSE